MNGKIILLTKSTVLTSQTLEGAEGYVREICGILKRLNSLDAAVKKITSWDGPCGYSDKRYIRLCNRKKNISLAALPEELFFVMNYAGSDIILHKSQKLHTAQPGLSVFSLTEIEGIPDTGSYGLVSDARDMRYLQEHGLDEKDILKSFDSDLEMAGWCLDTSFIPQEVRAIGKPNTEGIKNLLKDRYMELPSGHVLWLRKRRLAV